MFGWAFPSRRGSAPVSSADSPTFTSAESAVSSSEISMRSPPPACPRASRAARIAAAAARQAVHHLLPFRPREVERNAPLAAVDGQKIGRLAIRVRRPPGPRLVALTRALDLDDVRAEVGEQHRAVRARENAGEVEHADRG